MYLYRIFIVLSFCIIFFSEMTPVTRDDCIDLIMSKENFLTVNQCLINDFVTQYAELRPQQWPCYSICVYVDRGFFNEDLSPNLGKINESISGLEISEFNKDILINKTEECMRNYGYNFTDIANCSYNDKFSKCFTHVWDYAVDECQDRDRSIILGVPKPKKMAKLEIFKLPYKNELIRTLNVIRKDLTGYGVKFFLHFFKLYPNYQSMFSFVQKDEDLMKNLHLQSHAFNVLNYINGIIENLDDIDQFDYLLKRTGKNHHAKKIGIREFEDLRFALLDFLNITLGSRGWFKLSHESWNQFYDVLEYKILGTNPQNPSSTTSSVQKTSQNYYWQI